MDDYYERLNQAFDNWNGGEPSLEQRVENLEAEIIQKQDILTFDAEPVENSENPVTSGGLFSHFERYATKTALDNKVSTSSFTADQDRQDALEAEDRSALISLIDGGGKNILNLNTNFVAYTNKGITYTNNGDGTINVAGTSNAADSYVTLYDVNGDTFFGIPKGKTIVLKSTSNNISINLVYKKQGGGYGLTVRGYMDTPAMFTIPDDFAGYLLRIGVYVNGTTVNENVGAMICTTSDYAISPAFVPYRPSWQEMYDMIKALQSGS